MSLKFTQSFNVQSKTFGLEVTMAYFGFYTYIIFSIRTSKRVAGGHLATI